MSEQASAEQLARIRTLQKAAKARRENKLLAFQPYPKQREFIELTATKAEVLCLAGNQLGKSEIGAYTMAVMLTGEYPPGWKGRRFDRPIKARCIGEGAALVRDVSQAKLFGGVGELLGTGFVPKGLIIKTSAAHGVSDSFDQVHVRHKSGGTSVVDFRSYEAGRAKLQGWYNGDVIWLDEEPPSDIYAECMARGAAVTFTTCTPLNGPTEFIQRFLQDDTMEARRDRGYVRFGIKDVTHMTDEEKERRLASYPLHQREARAEGVPLLGSGAVFQNVLAADLRTTVTLADVRPEWFGIAGLDFGISHATAYVLCFHDRDADVVYVVDCFKMSNATILQIADRIKRIAPTIPVAWPHDGHQRDKGSGEALADQYRKHGVRMMDSHATLGDGQGYSTEAGVALLYDRMSTGRFRVSAHLRDWWDEFAVYRRDENGLIVKKNDDLMSATRQAVMQLRSSKQDVPVWAQKPRIQQMNTNFDLFTGKPHGWQPGQQQPLPGQPIAAPMRARSYDWQMGGPHNKR
jgi:phage terminase large subunit-like protein